MYQVESDSTFMAKNNVILQVGVKVLLMWPDGKPARPNDFGHSGRYLIAKRSARKYPDIKNPWDCIGGRINPGTPLLENLKREVKEETGIVLKSEPKLICAQDIIKKGVHIVRLTYISKVSQNTKPVSADGEMEDFAWKTSKELLGMKNLDEYLRAVLKTKSGK